MSVIELALDTWRKGAAQYSDRVPGHTIESLTRWVEDGIPTGGFLQAVLRNELKESVFHADLDNLKALPDIAYLIHNFAPGSVRDLGEWKGLNNLIDNHED